MNGQPSAKIFKGVCIDAAGGQICSDLIQFLVARTLEPFGHKFEMTWTGNGHEGLSLIANIRPDVVFLNFTVLGIDGFEVYHRIKADDTMKSIPIIIVTAKTSAIEDCIDGNLMTVEGCLAKPFLFKELAEIAMRVLPMPGQDSH